HRMMYSSPIFLMKQMEPGLSQTFLLNSDKRIGDETSDISLGLLQRTPKEMSWKNGLAAQTETINVRQNPPGQHTGIWFLYQMTVGATALNLLQKWTTPLRISVSS